MDMINTLFLTTVAVESNLSLFCCFSLWHSQIYVLALTSRAILSNIRRKDELKTTHNTFLDCQVHSLFRQPLKITVDWSRVC